MKRILTTAAAFTLGFLALTSHALAVDRHYDSHHRDIHNTGQRDRARISQRYPVNAHPAGVPHGYSQRGNTSVDRGNGHAALPYSPGRDYGTGSLPVVSRYSIGHTFPGSQAYSDRLNDSRLVGRPSSFGYSSDYRYPSRPTYNNQYARSPGLLGRGIHLDIGGVHVLGAGHHH
ncbi:hypothetical protein [Neorhodopirellula lusitana]|uniref:hypothetical protein n=1 Tax=Neorhodopirellula lusitana TaxID=445327 RepID=UPI0038516E0F